MSKKEDIITTALRLFNSHSYNSVGVDRIISESNVAKMTFYKYFPSKEKLIQECLIQRNQNLQASLNLTLAECDPTDHLDSLEQFLNGIQHGSIVTILTAACSKKHSKKLLKSTLRLWNQQHNIKFG